MDGKILEQCQHLFDELSIRIKEYKQFKEEVTETKKDLEDLNHDLHEIDIGLKKREKNLLSSERIIEMEQEVDRKLIEADQIFSDAVKRTQANTSVVEQERIDVQNREVRLDDNVKKFNEAVSAFDEERKNWKQKLIEKMHAEVG